MLKFTLVLCGAVISMLSSSTFFMLCFEFRVHLSIECTISGMQVSINFQSIAEDLFLQIFSLCVCCKCTLFRKLVLLRLILKMCVVVCFNLATQCATYLVFQSHILTTFSLVKINFEMCLYQCSYHLIDLQKPELTVPQVNLNLLSCRFTTLFC